ncbi:hypothetical protein HYFRA_00011496 [Hymenoscyphus fraxineus]|uniref:Cytochrome P450 n=1 Tax=Hymenoscyphus fraxineus TaxID=746836 RepID=A0A9N9PWU2_9HELO|nr:hypothetical protein HYFRA_00011496 [Hymenoscyphus fraxineus]
MSNPVWTFVSTWSGHESKTPPILIVIIISTIICSPFLKIFRKSWQRVLKRFQAWNYLFKGVEIVQAAFDKAGGQPFEVFAPDNRYVFVSSPKHIEELDRAPSSVLSMEAATKQMLQPQYTMHGHNWFDHRGTEGCGFIKALRHMLTDNLPQILPDLTTLVGARFAELCAESPTMNGSREVLLYPAITKLVVLCNSVSFFGRDLAKNEAFMTSALEHVEQTFICAEVVRLLPKALAPLVGKLLAMRLGAHKTIYDTLLPVAQQRCRERDQKDLGQQVPIHLMQVQNDCIQWILDTSPRKNPWTPARVVHEIIAIWFGSVHGISITVTFAIHDLCLHPEYRDPLRQELINQYTRLETTGVGLPLLDSFIKESARLSPLESQSTRRAALKPFTFSDGTKVHQGDWTCTPVRAIMQSAQHYPEPLQFHGFRFVDPLVLEQLSSATADRHWKDSPIQNTSARLTDIDSTWLVWGAGHITCPGRFYAAAVMQIILGQIIMGFDYKLVEDTSSRYMTWRTTMLPGQKTRVLFTPLDKAEK